MKPTKLSVKDLKIIGMLLSEYKLNYFYFEFVKMATRVVIILLFNVIDDTFYSAGVLIIMII
jgi:hypothetical protein